MIFYLYSYLKHIITKQYLQKTLDSRLNINICDSNSKKYSINIMHITMKTTCLLFLKNSYYKFIFR